MDKIRKEFKINEDIIVKDYIKNNLSRKYYRFLKNHQACFMVNDEKINNYDLLKKGDTLVIIYDNTNTTGITNNILLNIIYEDEYLMVIDKPNGLSTIPSRGDYSNSLYNAILYYYEQKNYQNTIHFINRLDKETSGLLLVAKDRFTAMLLEKELDKIDRYYIAYVKGIFDVKVGTINKKIAKAKDSIIKREISDIGKEAITHYQVLNEDNDNSFVLLKLETGRTHQIRVHLLSINHPIIGDSLYYEAEKRMYLDSYKISFYHPILEQQLEFERKPKFYE